LEKVAAIIKEIADKAAEVNKILPTPMPQPLPPDIGADVQKAFVQTPGQIFSSNALGFYLYTSSRNATGGIRLKLAEALRALTINLDALLKKFGFSPDQYFSAQNKIYQNYIDETLKINRAVLPDIYSSLSSPGSNVSSSATAQPPSTVQFDQGTIELLLVLDQASRDKVANIARTLKLPVQPDYWVPIGTVTTNKFNQELALDIRNKATETINDYANMRGVAYTFDTAQIAARGNNILLLPGFDTLQELQTVGSDVMDDLKSKFGMIVSSVKQSPHIILVENAPTDLLKRFSSPADVAPDTLSFQEVSMIMQASNLFEKLSEKNIGSYNPPPLIDPRKRATTSGSSSAAQETVQQVMQNLSPSMWENIFSSFQNQPQSSASVSPQSSAGKSSGTSTTKENVGNIFNVNVNTPTGSYRSSTTSPGTTTRTYSESSSSTTTVQSAALLPEAGPYAAIAKAINEFNTYMNENIRMSDDQGRAVPNPRNTILRWYGNQLGMGRLIGDRMPYDEIMRVLQGIVSRAKNINQTLSQQSSLPANIQSAARQVFIDSTQDLFGYSGLLATIQQSLPPKSPLFTTQKQYAAVLFELMTTLDAILSKLNVTPSILDKYRSLYSQLTFFKGK